MLSKMTASPHDDGVNSINLPIFIQDKKIFKASFSKLPPPRKDDYLVVAIEIYAWSYKGNK